MLRILVFASLVTVSGSYSTRTNFITCDGLVNADPEEGPVCVKQDEFFVQMCDGKKSCWCVDLKTGKEVPLTRTNRTERRTQLHCHPYNEYPVANATCKLPPHPGDACQGDFGKQIKWYFDVSTAECLAFEYNGCGGNANKFESKVDCTETCGTNLIYNPFYCHGMLRALNDTEYCWKNNIVPCPEGSGNCFKRAADKRKNQGCGDDHTCQIAGAIGRCCPDLIDKLYEERTSPKCGKNEEPHTSPGVYRAAYLGKTCASNHCPKDTRCVEGEFFAYCCRKTSA